MSTSAEPSLTNDTRQREGEVMYTALRKLGFVALVVLVLAGASLLPVSAAVETVLIFDDLGLPNGTVFTDQYADQGVIFSPQDGELQLQTATTPLFPEDPQGLAEIPYFTSVIIADFTPSASAAGAWIDFGGVALGVMIEAFDGPNATGNQLATAETTEEEFLGVQASGIKSVRIMKVESPAQRSFLVDHFTFKLEADGGDGVPAVSGRGAVVLTLLVLATLSAVLWRQRSPA